MVDNESLNPEVVEEDGVDQASENTDVENPEVGSSEGDVEQTASEPCESAAEDVVAEGPDKAVVGDVVEEENPADDEIVDPESAEEDPEAEEEESSEEDEGPGEDEDAGDSNSEGNGAES